MARTHTPSSARRGVRRGTTRGGRQVGTHHTRRQAAPQPEVENMDTMERLLNVLEALVPTQGSDNSADPQSFLDGTLKALRALGCSSERAVELTTYKLEHMANTWYETILLGRPAGAAPLTWDEFIPTHEARVRRFVEGLVGHPYTAVALQMKTLSYIDAVDLARKIENKGRDERAASELRKKAKTRGSFNGDFCENRRYSVLTGECFRCGQLGHNLRDCPQSPRNFNQASTQSVAPTHTTRNTLGSTGTGNKGRGAGDRAIVNKGQGNAGRGQARVFAFTRQDAQASNAVVTCILSICSFDALALIDLGSTHSYVSSCFALRFSRQPELLNDPFLVATPVGESLLAEYVCSACQIRVEGRDTLADLIVLDMINFYMLMGMDWLSSCYTIVDCHYKKRVIK
ncbi:uncharacterized protein [Nicotiana tomentosiformis]|uniref:uncharacterized protein n=1 Tax=Nicotiana tomentosiformis TaxID=4098 RepID=UPI00388C3F11